MQGQAATLGNGCRGGRRAAASVVLLVVAVPALAREISLALPPGDELVAPWSRKAFVEGIDTTAAEAFSVQLIRDPDEGRCVELGPWLAGKWYAGIVYDRDFPVAPLEVCGRYRTTDVLPFTSGIRIDYYAENNRRTTVRMALAPSDAWRTFVVRVDRFPPRAVRLRVSFGFVARTHGRLRLASLMVRPAAKRHSLDEMPRTGITRPAPPAPRPTSDRWSVAAHEGTWWLVDPAGAPFYALSTDARSFPRGRDAVRNCGEYVDTLRSWGFNSLGGWTNIWRYRDYNQARIDAGEPTFPMFVCLPSSHGAGEDFDVLEDARGNRKDGEHAFPDPFDPRFAARYRARVRERVELIGDTDYVAGWFVDNEMDFRDLYRYVWSRHCARAFLAAVRRRYRTIEAVNARWGTSFEDFAALARAKPTPPIARGPLHDDLAAFERVLVRKFVDVTLDAVRSQDPGRLVISNRHMMSGISDWMRTIDLAGAYDIVAVNLYPANNAPGLSDNERQVLRLVHERTRRPLIIGEWSVPSVEGGLYDGTGGAPLDWSFPQVVPTQAMRAAQAARVTCDFYNIPYVVGASWFTWHDFDSAKRRANRGLYRSDLTPWTELTRELTRAHAAIATHVGYGRSRGGAEE